MLLGPYRVKHLHGPRVVRDLGLIEAETAREALARLAPEPARRWPYSPLHRSDGCLTNPADPAERIEARFSELDTILDRDLDLDLDLDLDQPRRALPRRAIFRRLMACAVPLAVFLAPIAAASYPQSVMPNPFKSPGRPSPRGKHRVYVGVLPAGFTPGHVGDVPDQLGSLHCVLKRRTLTDAQAAVRAFNRWQLAAGIPGRLWAVLVARTRSRKAKGGEA